MQNIDGSTDELQEPDGNCITSEHSSNAYGLEKSKSGSKLSDRVKRKSWYNAIYPSYKTRSETFKKLFKDDVPDDQRLIVGRYRNSNVPLLLYNLEFCGMILLVNFRLLVRFTT